MVHETCWTCHDVFQSCQHFLEAEATDVIMYITCAHVRASRGLTKKAGSNPQPFRCDKNQGQ